MGGLHFTEYAITSKVQPKPCNMKCLLSALHCALQGTTADCACKACCNHTVELKLNNTVARKNAYKVVWSATVAPCSSSLL